ncbi:HNH endonuclease [Chitinophaga sp. S165]|uniref:HNH endonuclease n=1 Tax=Chitinophaga sp. S165 TaxID=2135462 RepID=UPI000D70AA37|nr:HNH endonuclease signature motif containing protein [Chitinophaga sp. S165]PWV45792.1 HNH endonuclease [Chitinophaga sp. S165]
MLIVNREYSKEDLYNIFDIPIEKRKGPWNTGYVKHNDTVFLFVNIGNAGRTGHNYANKWEEGNLIWYGKTDSHQGQALIQTMIDGICNVLVFTRTEDRSPYTYKGIAHYISHENTTPICITWKVIPDIPPKKAPFINIPLAWEIFIENAGLAAKTKEPFYSPLDGEEYCVQSTFDNKVWLERVSAARRNNLQPPFPKESFTYERFIKCSKKFNLTDGKAPKTTIDNTVLYETTFVEFLPLLEWDTENKNIIFSPYADSEMEKLEIPGTSFEEAPNDILLQQINLLKRSRKGQRHLKKNLLIQYNNKCCVTACDVEAALHACHIQPHRINGDNDSKNALLLRADIHVLWDKNLIGIHPKTLEIHIASKLKSSHYAFLVGKKLAIRKDLMQPSEKLLKVRWSEFKILSNNAFETRNP